MNPNWGDGEIKIWAWRLSAINHVSHHHLSQHVLNMMIGCVMIINVTDIGTSIKCHSG